MTDPSPETQPAERPRKIMFDCPEHRLQTGKPIRGNAVLRLSCGCEFVAITGIGWLPNRSDMTNDISSHDPQELWTTAI